MTIFGNFFFKNCDLIFFANKLTKRPCTEKLESSVHWSTAITKKKVKIELNLEIKNWKHLLRAPNKC